MPYPERLDPREVLAHLHELGYHHITAYQLKDFIHDLKKLIKHDQRLREEADKENITQLDDSHLTSHSSKYSCDNEKLIDLEDDNVSSSSSTSKLTESSTSLTECTCTDDEESKKYLRYGSLNQGKSFGKSLPSLSQSQRPQSSFIRPWRLHPSHKGFSGNPSQKTDPVKLYHKYKEIWAQQKVPGENDHSQLRWTIREKMLGQDPHPRPMSQASSDIRRKPNRL